MPVAYESKLLKAVEKNYSTTEKKIMAVIWVAKTFKPYVFGMHFKIIIDHSTLKIMLSNKI